MGKPDDARPAFAGLPVDPDLPERDRPAAELPSARRLRRERPANLLAVGSGGALGAAARYGVGLALPAGSGHFPWATFAVNISGALVLGAFLVLVVRRRPPIRYLRLFAATGFIGSYTTFSTYVVDVDLLGRDGQAALAALYGAGSIAAGLAAVWLGVVLGRLLAAVGRTSGRCG